MCVNYLGTRTQKAIFHESISLLVVAVKLKIHLQTEEFNLYIIINFLKDEMNIKKKTQTYNGWYIFLTAAFHYEILIHSIMFGIL